MINSDTQWFARIIIKQATTNIVLTDDNKFIKTVTPEEYIDIDLPIDASRFDKNANSLAEPYIHAIRCSKRFDSKNLFLSPILLLSRLIDKQQTKSL